jgi:hypothetical protein
MSPAAAPWHSLVGHWSGHDRVWFEPSTIANECDASLVVRPTLGGRGMVLESTWSRGDDEQFTTLLLVAGESGHEGVLVDTFHTGGSPMALHPSPEPGGDLLVDVAGTYDGDGADWGWRVTLRQVDHDHLVIEAHNVSPEGDAALAVRTEHVRTIDPHDEITI